MSYTFQSVEDTGKLTEDSKICNIIDGFADYANQFALVCGKIKAVFGKPLYETEDLENLFSYCILATSEEGEEVYLRVYCAGSGPAVGGAQNEASQKAAEALVDYIWQAPPVDYACRAYYLDGPTVSEFGLRDGIPYDQERELSEKEFKEVYARLWGEV